MALPMCISLSPLMSGKVSSILLLDSLKKHLVGVYCFPAATHTHTQRIPIFDVIYSHVVVAKQSLEAQIII